ncbi:MAG: copper oxidase [Sandaracinaceae bacterium]|nr:copper oxidase [Sandaracinaceae bacterium]
MDRRRFLVGSSALLGSSAVATGAASQARPSPEAEAIAEPAQRVPTGAPSPLIVPNGAILPHRVVDGVKVFHLVAEEFDHEIASGLVIRAWGFNGRTPGPVIEAVEGDRVRIYVTNRLPEPTVTHWHGLFVPTGMDGVSGLTQPPIEPGRTFRYELEMRRAGTFMYHSHYDEMTQIALGAVGMFIVHPRRPIGPRIDRDFVLMLHEWSIHPGTRRPNALAMNDFNVLTLNGKAYPATAPLVARRGERVRIRLGNLGPMDHHPIHLHGYAFEITATDGGPIAPSARWRETTVLVPVGSTRDVELVATEVGDWAMHCHMTHHIMNQMGHDTPTTIGADTRAADALIARTVPDYMSMGQRGMGDMAAMQMPLPDNAISMRSAPGPHGTIDMGGMFTVLKVREELESYDDPGWWEPPPGTLAREATEDELRADGVDPAAR